MIKNKFAKEIEIDRKRERTFGCLLSDDGFSPLELQRKKKSFLA